MNDLILVPIEPLSERYSEQWYRNFPLAFSDYFNVTVIDGTPLLDDVIKVGAFLDINSTTHYKWSQLQQISKLFNDGKVKRNTVFFFSDIEFWGLEAVRLLADMNKVPIKMVGFLHAGSYTREDAFEIAAPYQQYTEVGWVAALDQVYVGSAYHKEAFIERRLKPLGASHLASKIYVTGNPIFYKEYPKFDNDKENIVVLTNRFDYEKRPGDTLFLFEEAKKKHPDWKFIITTGRPTLRSNFEELVVYARHLEEMGVIEIYDGLSKYSYHHILSKAKVMVSHSIEENFGYCIAEALVYGVVPMLRKGLSHSNLLKDDKSMLFDADTDQVEMLENLMSDEYQEKFRDNDIAEKLISPYYASQLTIMSNMLNLY